ncbi:hypothetical protein PCANC_22896 [Puccinia coronata f. sp. avenae]|uniref:Retrotransposon gag domain-containing protein n=1 Tax=Puccinia coronata f. sp. avenae TaxID=200324 RepID=A0A2N5U0I4_9BASI|nr:hypothetical protein PCANC_22896 [Puccinia coronata f. sp. avenae]
MPDKQATNPPPPQPQQPQRDKQVDLLAQQVTGLRSDLLLLFEMLESGARLRPDDNYPPHPPPPQASSGFHPHPQHPRVPPFMPRMEPPRLPDVWFAGDLGQLLSFLRTIRDHLCPRVSYFKSDTRRIIWILRNFGFGPNHQHRGNNTSPVENWYTLLITDNARQHGSFNPYGDLDGIPFTIPALCSVEAFLEALILVFGNRFMKENAKRALAACKQGSSTIGEYNSHFSSLVYLVEDVEEARVERYVSGLNPRIICQAMSKEWRGANTLDARMDLATKAAAQLDLLSLLPSDGSSQPRHCPFSSAPPPGLSFPPPPCSASQGP